MLFLSSFVINKSKKQLLLEVEKKGVKNKPGSRPAPRAPALNTDAFSSPEHSVERTAQSKRP